MTALKYDIFGITLFDGVKSFSEGGARGWLGLILGAAVGVAALAYVWGPFDVASKASAPTEPEDQKKVEAKEDTATTTSTRLDHP